MNIYVGNLSYSVTEEDLREAFSAYGTVASAHLIKDKFSGQSKGFGFVEMPDASEAAAAMSALSGKEMKGRTLTVNEARPPANDRKGGGGGAGRRSGGGGERRRY